MLLGLGNTGIQDDVVLVVVEVDCVKQAERQQPVLVPLFACQQVSDHEPDVREGHAADPEAADAAGTDSALPDSSSGHQALLVKVNDVESRNLGGLCKYKRIQSSGVQREAPAFLFAAGRLSRDIRLRLVAFARKVLPGQSGFQVAVLLEPYGFFPIADQVVEPGEEILSEDALNSIAEREQFPQVVENPLRWSGQLLRSISTSSSFIHKNVKPRSSSRLPTTRRGLFFPPTAAGWLTPPMRRDGPRFT